MNYIEDFLERNKSKSFVTNLMKYADLEYYAKAKVVSSFLTHLLIDAEQGRNNEKYISDIISILNTIILYKQDNFLQWLSDVE